MTSEMMPTMRGGSRPNGGSGNAVTLVRTVVARKSAVQPDSSLPPTRATRTISPDAMPIRLTTTWILRNTSVGMPQVILCPSSDEGKWIDGSVHPRFLACVHVRDRVVPPRRDGVHVELR